MESSPDLVRIVSKGTPNGNRIIKEKDCLYIVENVQDCDGKKLYRLRSSKSFLDTLVLREDDVDIEIKFLARKD